MTVRPQRSGLCSVVIPTCNEGVMLHQTVENILEETTYSDFEVIIVDDGSTDGSCDRLKNSDDRIRVIAGGNLGVPRARNLGAGHAAGEYLIFLDAHCRISPSWLDLFVAALVAPDIALVGPCFTRLDQPEPRGCGMTWINHTLETAWFTPCEIDEPYEVPISPGGCQAFRATTFNAIGKFEPGFARWGFEDIEICLRAWLLGYRVVVDPRIVIAHHFREARNFEVVQKDILYNLLRMVHMHFSQERIKRTIAAIGYQPDFTAALDILYASDVITLREELHAVRVRNDDWYFTVFMPNLL